MHLPLTEALVPPRGLIVFDQTGSTNDELRMLASDPSTPVPEFTTVVTSSQTAGRGRLGRVWVAPPGQGLAMSVLLRPTLPNGAPLPIEYWGWLPLIAGVAMTRAVASLLPGRQVALKWPNDVQVGGLKVCGILAELLPGTANSGDAVVLGMGLNLAIPADGLPTPHSTSLLVEGAELAGVALADAAGSRWHTQFQLLYRAFTVAGGEAETSGIRSAVDAVCSTLGNRVRVHLPGGADLVGSAVDIDGSGRLRIRDDTDASLQAVAAGDVTHLRYE